MCYRLHTFKIHSPIADIRHIKHSSDIYHRIPANDRLIHIRVLSAQMRHQEAAVRPSSQHNLLTVYGKLLCSDICCQLAVFNVGVAGLAR